MFLKDFDLGTVRDFQTNASVGGSELQSLIEKRRQEFSSRGLKERDVVLLECHNTTSFFIDLLALWEMSACAALLESGSQAETVNRLVRYLGARWKLSAAGAIREISNQATSIRLPDGAALILFTSGTTGVPRGVVHDFASLRKKMDTLAKFIPAEEIRKTLCALPTSFGHGLICNSLYPLLSGASLYIECGFTLPFVSRLTEYCQSHQITFMSSTPTVWNLVQGLANQKRTPPLLRIHCASAPLDRKRIRSMRAWCPEARLFNVYGLTEFLGWVSGHELTEEDAGDCVGTPWGVDCAVSDEKPGRILLDGEFKFKGYLDWNGSQYVFTPTPKGLFDTGDLGSLTNDKEISIRGRSKLVINKSGFKIGPEEIEAHLAEYEGLIESCCFPVEDDFSGQRIGLAVVVDGSNGKPSSQLLKAQICNWLSEKVPRYKIPDYVWVLDSLPRNSRGKVDRSALIQKFGASKP